MGVGAVWHRRHAGWDHHRTAVGLLARQSAAVLVVRPLEAVAHQRGDLRVRRQHALRWHLLLHATPGEGTACVGHLVVGPFLGLAADHRRSGRESPARLHDRQRVRGARMAARHFDRAHLGRLRGELLLDLGQASRKASVRRDMVLHRDDHHRRGAAHRQ